MQTSDPIKQFDKVVREAQETAGKYTRPVLRRYPFLFALLLTFAFSAIVVGFHLWADTISLFEKHPAILILIGVVILFLTGTLYKTLKNHRE